MGRDRSGRRREIRPGIDEPGEFSLPRVGHPGVYYWGSAQGRVVDLSDPFRSWMHGARKGMAIFSVFKLLILTLVHLPGVCSRGLQGFINSHCRADCS